MSDRSEETRTREERDAQELVRALPDVDARESFRNTLREDFVSGSIGERRAVVFPIARSLMGLAAAAAIAATFFVLNRGPEWQVVSVQGEGSVRVGDTVLGVAEAEEALAARLRPGTELAAEGDVMVDLMLAETLAVQMAPGSRLRLPASPGRWIGRSLRARVEDGEIRFVTGPSFDGVRLRVGAPAAMVEVTGTTFAVISTADSTCVCVLDGEVMVEALDGCVDMLSGGMRRTLFSERSGALDEEIYPMERSKLEMLRDRAEAEMDR